MSPTRVRLPFSKRSALRKLNKQNRWNCAPPAISPGCGASKADAPKPATPSPRSIAWFTEGFDTADLKEAKALLYQLA